MTISEIVYDKTIGAFVQYGKTAAGVIKAMRVNDDGELVMAGDSAISADIAEIKADIADIKAILES